MSKKTPAEKILSGYLEAALFTAPEDDDGNIPTDGCSVGDFTDSAVKKAAASVEKFLKKPGVEEAIDLAQELDLPERGSGEYSFYEQLGHDLWMTENGHGVGFWDGDWGDAEEEPAKTLNKAAGRHESYVYVNDDGTVGLD